MNGFSLQLSEFEREIAIQLFEVVAVKDELF
jgi:hypothetical protein